MRDAVTDDETLGRGSVRVKARRAEERNILAIVENAARGKATMHPYRRLPFVLAALCALSSTPAAFAQLSATEQQIIAAVKERTPAALQLLERTVNVNSGTMNADGVREVGRMFRAEFDQLGFSTKWVEMPPEMLRAGHLVATREGKQGKRLLLIGHLDTVFEKDSPVQLWDRKGDKVRGHG